MAVYSVRIDFERPENLSPDALAAIERHVLTSVEAISVPMATWYMYLRRLTIAADGLPSCAGGDNDGER